MLRSILSAVLMFFLPGFTLINAIYPAKGQLDDELDMLYRITYGLGLSAAVVVILGFILGNIQLGGKGLFIPEALSAGLVALTIIFFLIGWLRGAYQRLAHISPKLCRTSPEVSAVEGKDIQKVKRLQKLAKKRGRLKERLKYTEKMIEKSEEGEEEKLKWEKESIQEQLEEVEKRLKEAEKDRETDF